jgi:16S rRNA (uracil1498-N3)-methyltransferase
VERDDRSPVGTFFVDAALAAGATASLGDQAAHHARVKRLLAGDAVRLTDGAGSLATGTIGDIRRTSLVVAVERVRTVNRPAAIHLRVPVADRDRMLWLAEKATELGVTSWQSVRFRRSASVSPRGEGDAFHEKLRARMVSALEQSGGAWLPSVVADTQVEELRAEPGQLPIVLDPGGAPLASLMILATAGDEPVVLVGPEGGIEPEELSALLAGGWRAASLADTILRFETAGIAGIAVVRAAQLVGGGGK